MSKKVSHIGFDHPSMKTGFWSLPDKEKDAVAEWMVALSNGPKLKIAPKLNSSGKPGG